jgi:hypothetical protein
MYEAEPKQATAVNAGDKGCLMTRGLQPNTYAWSDAGHGSETVCLFLGGVVETFSPSAGDMDADRQILNVCWPCIASSMRLEGGCGTPTRGV